MMSLTEPALQFKNFFRVKPRVAYLTDEDLRLAIALPPRNVKERFCHFGEEKDDAPDEDRRHKDHQRGNVFRVLIATAEVHITSALLLSLVVAI